MPRLSLTMESGVLVKWLKAVGDPVQKGESLAEIETDKANAVLEAPAAGYLRRTLVDEGVEVACDATVGILTATPDEPCEQADAEEPVTQRHPEGTRQRVPGEAAALRPAAPRTARASGAPVQASPAAKHLAKQLGIDLSTVVGTGPGGRISSEDVQRAADEGASVSPENGASTDGERRVPLTKMRAAIAQRMTLSATTVPQFMARRRVDMSAALRFRERWLALRSGQPEGAHVPGVADILHLSVSRALLAHPEVNSSFEAGNAEAPRGYPPEGTRPDTSFVVLHGSVNLGIAVALSDGLIVPVIHRAHEMSLEQLTAARHRLQEEAMSSRLPAGALTGATFTVSNLGTMGVDDFAAIVNPPEAAILAVGRMEQTLVVRDGAIHTLPMVTLTVTADHRVLDGAQVARFVDTLAGYLSDPDVIAS